MANIIADGFSMAAGNFLGTKTEHDEIKHLEEIENRHIDTFPEGEREEVRQIFKARGFDGEDLERVSELITSDRTRWVRTMLTEEYGLPKEVRSPWLAAISTFSAFIICGLAALIPFLFALPFPLVFASILTGCVFFAIGSLKSLWSTVSWWRSGFGTLGVGSAAASLAYIGGYC